MRLPARFPRVTRGQEWVYLTPNCYPKSRVRSSDAFGRFEHCFEFALTVLYAPPLWPLASITSRHHSPSVRPSACAAVSSCAYSSSLTLKPMDFVRSGGFTMSRLPLSPSQPRLAAALKNQQVRLR